MQGYRPEDHCVQIRLCRVITQNTVLCLNQTMQCYSPKDCGMFKLDYVVLYPKECVLFLKHMCPNFLGSVLNQCAHSSLWTHCYALSTILTCCWLNILFSHFFGALDSEAWISYLQPSRQHIGHPKPH